MSKKNGQVGQLLHWYDRFQPNPSDPVIKQYLLHKDKETTKFVIRDLDETTLFVKSDKMEEINRFMDELHDKNSFKGLDKK
jgi:hypothetical protein